MTGFALKLGPYQDGTWDGDCTGTAYFAGCERDKFGLFDGGGIARSVI